MEDEYLTSVEAGRILKLDWKTLRRWRYERKGPPFLRVGRNVRYLRSELDAWIKAQNTARSA